MPAEMFFARLPRGTLSADEAELRRLLLDTAAAASRLLPHSGEVSLQQWVQRRMPGELVIGTDSTGLFNLLPAKPVGKAPQAAAANSWLSDSFFNSLSDSALNTEERRLRDILVELLTRGPQPLGRMVQDGQVKHAKLFLPHGILLEQWIERRIFAEVVVYDGWDGVLMCKLAPPSKEDRMGQVEAFFEDLPEDTFTEAELNLRASILDVLEARNGCAILSLIGADKTVGAARRACLIPGVSLKEWIGRRVASELSMDDAGNGQWNVRLLETWDSGRQTGEGEMRDTYDMDEQERLDMDAQKQLDQQDKAERRQAFFDELPVDSLRSDEFELREALLDFLDRWTGDTPATLSNAGTDEKVNASRAALLPKGISLRDWVDHRVGGEIELVRMEGETSEVFIAKRGEMDPVALARGRERLKVSKRARDRAEKNGGGKRGADGRSKGKAKGKGKAGADEGQRQSHHGRPKGKDKGHGKGDMEPHFKRRRM